MGLSWDRKRTAIRWSRKIFGVLALCLGGLLTSPARGYDVEYSVQPRAVNVGDPVQIRFAFRGLANPPTPQLQGIEGFQVTGRPQIGKHTVLLNDKVNTDISFTYTLYASEPGTFSIGPMNYTAGGETKMLPAVEIQVAPRSENAALFARISVEKEAVFLHETFEVTLTIFSHQLDLGADFRLLNMPDSRLNFQPFHEVQAEPEMVNGRAYKTKKFRSEVRALASGEFTIAPALRVPIQKKSSRRSAFDMFFGGSQVEYTQISPDPIQLRVNPLPQEGRPESFTGAVGTFSFEVAAQPLTVTAGDPINLTMKLAGRGNMDAVSTPKLELGPDFKIYESRLVQKELNDRRTRGFKIFEQVVIPKSESVEAIPSLAFSYFDPVNATYNTIEQGPFKIDVSPSTNAAVRLLQVASDAGSPELRVLQQDIVYLKPAPETWQTGREAVWYTHPFTVGLQVVPAAACLLGFLLARRREELSQNIAKARRLRAPRSARNAARRVEEALAFGNHKEFYEGMWDALSSFFGDLFNLHPGEVGSRRVMELLADAGLDRSAMTEVANLFERCEQARFAAAPDETDREKLEQLLRNLEHVFHTCGKLKP